MWGRYGDTYWEDENRKPFELEYEASTAECCAIANVTGFPHDHDFNHQRKRYKDCLKDGLLEAIKSAQADNHSMLFASVNTNQLEAEKVLIEMGFVCPFDGWAYRNPKHLHEGSTGVKHYTKALFQIRKRVRKAKR